MDWYASSYEVYIRVRTYQSLYMCMCVFKDVISYAGLQPPLLSSIFSFSSNIFPDTTVIIETYR